MEKYYFATNLTPRLKTLSPPPSHAKRHKRDTLSMDVARYFNDIEGT